MRVVQVWGQTAQQQYSMTVGSKFQTQHERVTLSQVEQLQT